MINRAYFKEIKKEMEKYDAKREDLIKKSRDVIKFSKEIIYAIHRKDLKSAEESVKKIDKALSDMTKEVKKDPKLDIGSYRVAVQEYVEALCYFAFVKNKKLPTHKDLGVTSEYYLLGLCDLTGELVRKAINSAIKGDTKPAFEIKDFVEELYNELMLFDFRGGELRKKFDSIKYDLGKLDQLAFDITVKK
ncbi:hypothetical protein KY335_04110 [Candidatus Woesearchaeota archaeon]|nr:hypothetical protein [Candidatus Woesearchaeota archaeon]MBW3014396.1 hypothetical protein [Candidatus Woesearchaeota archaeon]